MSDVGRPAPRGCTNAGEQRALGPHGYAIAAMPAAMRLTCLCRHVPRAVNAARGLPTGSAMAAVALSGPGHEPASAMRGTRAGRMVVRYSLCAGSMTRTRVACSSSAGRIDRERWALISMPSARQACRELAGGGCPGEAKMPMDDTRTASPNCWRRSASATGLRHRFAVQTKTMWGMGMGLGGVSDDSCDLSGQPVVCAHVRHHGAASHFGWNIAGATPMPVAHARHQRTINETGTYYDG
jgi:hypothetical protein